MASICHAMRQEEECRWWRHLRSRPRAEICCPFTFAGTIACCSQLLLMWVLLFFIKPVPNITTLWSLHFAFIESVWMKEWRRIGAIWAVPGFILCAAGFHPHLTGWFNLFWGERLIIPLSWVCTATLEDRAVDCSTIFCLKHYCTFLGKVWN